MKPLTRKDGWHVSCPLCTNYAISRIWAPSLTYFGAMSIHRRNRVVDLLYQVHAHILTQLNHNKGSANSASDKWFQTKSEEFSRIHYSSVITTKLIFSLGHVLPADMEEAVFTVCTAASHKGAIKINFFLSFEKQRCWPVFVLPSVIETQRQPSQHTRAKKLPQKMKGTLNHHI